MRSEVPLLEVSDLVVRFPLPRSISATVTRQAHSAVHAVDGISLTIHSNELVALVGESGSGKTTTAHAITRLVEADEGSIRFEGEELTAVSHRAMQRLRRSIQLVYQDPYEALDPRFRVQRAIEEPLLIHGIGGSRAERAALVEDALRRVELDPDLVLRRYPHELSGGQRQRVALAAALVLRPKLLVLDEPVSMLDVSVRAGILGLLAGLRSEGLGLLMITHDLSTAARFADRILVMYLGRVVEQGSAQAIVGDPRHPYTKALLSVVPRRDPRRKVEPQILRGESPDPSNVPDGCRFHPRCPIAVERCAVVDPALEAVPGEPSSHCAACIRMAEQEARREAAVG